MFRGSNFSLSLRSLMDDGYYFLVAEQESNQRNQHRGGADREVYRHFLNIPPLLPRLRAALPYVPLPAPIEGFFCSRSDRRRTAANLITAYFKQICVSVWDSGCVSRKVLGLIMKSTGTQLPTRAGRGSGGGWLKVGETMWLKSAVAKDFADNASPGRFLWFVSCADTRNEHIPVLGQNQ